MKFVLRVLSVLLAELLEPATSRAIQGCPAIPGVRNGAYEVIKIHDTSPYIQVRYSCNDGYYMEGTDTIICTDFGQTQRWHPDAPTCLEFKNCVDIPYIQHGYATGDNCCRPGHKLGFVCDDDTEYQLIGADSLTCLNNGSWNHPIPECRSRCCKDPGFPPHGDVEYMKGGKFYYDDCCGHGVEAHFICNEGHDIVGPRVITCHNREWSAPRPRCKPKDVEVCEDVAVPNSVLSGDKTHGDYFGAGDWVFVSCKDGYRITGAELLDCNESGVWSSPVPSCVEYNCSLADLNVGPHIIVEDSNVTEFPAGSRIDLKCENGYMLSGASGLVCKDGRWSGRAKCLQFHCGRPSVPEFGWMTINTSFVGAMASFGCENGYMLQGSADRFCLANGVWSGTVARCVREVPLINVRHCESPGIPDNGLKMGSYYEVGAKVTFSCNRGYHLRGADTIVCDKKGHWSRTLPSCIGRFYYDIPWTVKENLLKPLQEIEATTDALNAEVQAPRERALILNASSVRHVVYFVIDASSSVGERDFKKGLALVRAMIIKINVTEQGHRVGIMTFSSNVTKAVDPKLHTSMDDVLEKFAAINYTGGGTALTTALLDVQKDFDGVSGRFLDENTKLKFSIFLITDGKSNLGGSPRKVMKELKEHQHKAEVYGIGVTNAPDLRVLADLVSEPVEEHLFILLDYDSIQWLADDLTNGIIDYSVCGSTQRHNVDTGNEDEDERENDVQPRIIEGEVVESAWPWMVEVKTTNSMCGGSIISRTWVMSAAHCIWDWDTNRVLDKSDITVRLGLTHIRRASWVQIILIKRVVVHEKYDTATFENDIALLELERNMIYGPFVRPICLPSEKDGNNGEFYQPEKHAFVIGWGKTEHGRASNVLRQAKVTIVSNKGCAEAYKQQHWNVTDGMMCASGFGKGDACQGDSGGPLMQGVAKDEYIWTQVGIVSWGEGCNRIDMPGVYTNVARYRSWIDQYVPDAQQSQ